VNELSRYGLMISSEPMNLAVATERQVASAAGMLCTRPLVDARTSFTRFRHERGFNPAVQDHGWEKEESPRLSFSSPPTGRFQGGDRSGLDVQADGLVRGMWEDGWAIGKWNWPERIDIRPRRTSG
jgi:hypothetical protein